MSKNVCTFNHCPCREDDLVFANAFEQVDDAIRIRDNQRRSRARRKDLIKDLQLRVQEYEQKGVAATQDMQRAARKVVQENERLRTLLARHGVSKEEVDSFLRMCDQSDASSTAESMEAQPAMISRSSIVSINAYPAINAGPRSLRVQPISPAYPKDFSPHPSPVSRPSAPAVQISRRQSVQPSPVTMSKCGPAPQCGGPSNACGPPSRPLDPHMEVTTNGTPSTTNPSFEPRTHHHQVETYYASPTDTGSSSPSSLSSRQPPQETQQQLQQQLQQQPQPIFAPRPPYNTPPAGPTKPQSQGCCPPPKPQAEATAEDPACPTTDDCFCPPTATVPPEPSAGSNAAGRRTLSNDEMSCETAATIIAQMRGDGDDIAARRSLGCGPQEMCSIKNTFLMQVLDER